MTTSSIALNASQPLSHSIKSWWQWLVDAPADQPKSVPAQQLSKHLALVPQHPDGHGSSITPANRPLRVVRVLETGLAGTTARLRISGRMDDVCAELDRLASLEARLH